MEPAQAPHPTGQLSTQPASECIAQAAQAHAPGILGAVQQRSVAHGRVSQAGETTVSYCSLWSPLVPFAPLWSLLIPIKLLLLALLLGCQVTWKFVVHGVIDGFSRYIVSLRVATNNRKSTVAAFFMEAVDQLDRGLPLRVRGDRGGENRDVAKIMYRARGVDSGAFISGRSVHNQRIERLWGNVNPAVLHQFKELFEHMGESGLIDVLNDIHILALHVVSTQSVHRIATNFLPFLTHLCSPLLPFAPRRFLPRFIYHTLPVPSSSSNGCTIVTVSERNSTAVPLRYSRMVSMRRS